MPAGAVGIGAATRAAPVAVPIGAAIPVAQAAAITRASTPAARTPAPTRTGVAAEIGAATTTHRADRVAPLTLAFAPVCSGWAGAPTLLEIENPALEAQAR